MPPKKPGKGKGGKPPGKSNDKDSGGGKRRVTVKKFVRAAGGKFGRCSRDLTFEEFLAIPRADFDPVRTYTLDGWPDLEIRVLRWVPTLLWRVCPVSNLLLPHHRAPAAPATVGGVLPGAAPGTAVPATAETGMLGPAPYPDLSIRGFTANSIGAARALWRQAGRAVRPLLPWRPAQLLTVLFPAARPSDPPAPDARDGGPLLQPHLASAAQSGPCGSQPLPPRTSSLTRESDFFHSWWFGSRSFNVFSFSLPQTPLTGDDPEPAGSGWRPPHRSSRETVATGPSSSVSRPLAGSDSASMVSDTEEAESWSALCNDLFPQDWSHSADSGALATEVQSEAEAEEEDCPMLYLSSASPSPDRSHSLATEAVAVAVTVEQPPCSLAAEVGVDALTPGAPSGSRALTLPAAAGAEPAHHIVRGIAVNVTAERVDGHLAIGVQVVEDGVVAPVANQAGSLARRSRPRRFHLEQSVQTGPLQPPRSLAAQVGGDPLAPLPVAVARLEPTSGRTRHTSAAGVEVTATAQRVFGLLMVDVRVVEGGAQTHRFYLIEYSRQEEEEADQEAEAGQDDGEED